MTNYEHYKEQIEKITRLGYQVAVNANDNQPYFCNELDCNDCIASKLINGYKQCYKTISEWADAEYIEPEKQVDWSKVAVDTPILVRDYPDKKWQERYFAKYENEKVFTFCNGCTSWSSCGVSDVVNWNFAKLAEVDNGI